MKKILIIGARGGIGAALAAHAQQQGAAVTGLSRSTDGFDLQNPDSVRAALEGLKEQKFDGVIVASGALEIAGAAPEKTIKAITAEAMAAQFAVNAIGPALILSQIGALLARDRRSVVAVLSARVGSIGDNRLGGWISYRAAKAAVNQIIRTSAIELSRTHPQSICVALHPGTVQTPFTEKYLGRHPAVPPSEAAGNLWHVMSALKQDQTGGFYDYAGEEIPW